MSKFDKLTAFIPLIKQDDIGDWVVEDNSSEEKSYIMPYVDYSDMVSEFVHTAIDIEMNIPEATPPYALDIIKEKGFAGRPLSEVDVSDFDEIGILSIISLAISGERFCDGLLLGLFKDGTILRWLEKLKEVDVN